MTQKNAVKIFEDRKVRSLWDDEAEEWYFSIVDVITVLTDSIDPLAYWRKLKQRLKAEGNETVTTCHALKMLAADGKMRLTDVATAEELFRLIQSIPSPKAEPFKLWIARVAAERLDQMQDPELSIQQAMVDYKRLGYSGNWINQRLKSIEIRKDLTDEWKKHGLEEGRDFALLTDIIYKTWAGKTAKEYKQHKGLKKENLRDNMTNRELVLNMLAEVSTKDISEATEPGDFAEHADVARRGGNVAKKARQQLEKELLWHYTSIEAALAILNTRIMRVTHYSFLNDSEELRLGLNSCFWYKIGTTLVQEFPSAAEVFSMEKSYLVKRNDVLYFRMAVPKLFRNRFAAGRLRIPPRAGDSADGHIGQRHRRTAAWRKSPPSCYLYKLDWTPGTLPILN